ncbi:hypothetical protein GWG65_27440 [Bradyrhizobium sp. CSA207]|uniref:winged helix-turn-helix transcriptional regulator n=1 Tax=Bradyrhizobium sp. CSA207 TaxID=2698826 RepID=UPI0023AF0606|nr:winged helix-turn-helix transcriptional regulator [Bradyrhizobium sp. CSA207]MDE5445112.1 hypothetical protein [Bradyrhizobium sp. CSA207]
MLTFTVRGLERDGLLTRTVYPTTPPRVDYALTPLGSTLWQAIEPFADWAREHVGVSSCSMNLPKGSLLRSSSRWRPCSSSGVIAQTEGGIVQGLSWALKESVSFDDRSITSLNWSRYPIMTYPEVPPIDVILIDRPELPSLGAGEGSVGAASAALANAFAHATGKRIRDLPFSPERVKASLS